MSLQPSGANEAQCCKTSPVTSVRTTKHTNKKANKQTNIHTNKKYKKQAQQTNNIFAYSQSQFGLQHLTIGKGKVQKKKENKINKCLVLCMYVQPEMVKC